MQLEQPLKSAAPAAGREEGEQALEHQHQGQRGPEGGAVQAGLAYFLAGAAGAPLPRKALKNSEPDGSSTMTSPFLLKLAL